MSHDPQPRRGELDDLLTEEELASTAPPPPRPRRPQQSAMAGRAAGPAVAPAAPTGAAGPSPSSQSGPSPQELEAQQGAELASLIAGVPTGSAPPFAENPKVNPYANMAPVYGLPPRQSDLGDAATLSQWRHGQKPMTDWDNSPEDLEAERILNKQFEPHLFEPKLYHVLTRPFDTTNYFLNNHSNLRDLKLALTASALVVAPSTLMQIAAEGAPPSILLMLPITIVFGAIGVALSACWAGLMYRLSGMVINATASIHRLIVGQLVVMLAGAMMLWIVCAGMIVSIGAAEVNPVLGAVVALPTVLAMPVSAIWLLYIQFRALAAAEGYSTAMALGHWLLAIVTHVLIMVVLVGTLAAIVSVLG